MENCGKCNTGFELHNVEEKLARRVCVCEQAKKCHKKNCEAPVTQAELVSGAPTIVKNYRCEEHGFEELRQPVVVEAAPTPAPAEVVAPSVVEPPVAVEPVVLEQAASTPEIKPLTQTIAENCFVVVEIALAAQAGVSEQVEEGYALTSRCVPPLTVVTCVKCSDTHTLRSRTPVVVEDEKTHVGLHRTVCPKCDDSALFIIAPSRT